MSIFNARYRGFSYLPPVDITVAAGASGFRTDAWRAFLGAIDSFESRILNGEVIPNIVAPGIDLVVTSKTSFRVYAFTDFIADFSTIPHVYTATFDAEAVNNESLP